MNGESNWKTRTRAGQRSQEEFWLTQALGPQGFFPQATTHCWPLCPRSNSSPEETTATPEELVPRAHPAPALQDKCCWMSMDYSHQCGKGATFCCFPFRETKASHTHGCCTVIEKSTGMLLTFTGHRACKCCFSLTQVIPCICIWCSKLPGYMPSFLLLSQE